MRPCGLGLSSIYVPGIPSDTTISSFLHAIIAAIGFNVETVTYKNIKVKIA